MTLKPGVRLVGVRPETVAAMMVANSIWTSLGKELVITSCADGKHSSNSLHYSGAAFDCRVLDIDPSLYETMRVRLAVALGMDFDVVLESDHIHVEFQPKRGVS